jgi:hypothetical protein
MARSLIACVLVAFAGSTDATTSATPSAPPTATCESIVDPQGSFTWRPRRVVLGVVAVPPAYIPQTQPTGEGRWRFWSKAGLVVRAESPTVLVSVPRRWRNRVAIGWGDAGPTSALRIASCLPSNGSLGEWNPYTGGFHLRSRAACVPLTFHVGGRRAIVRFGVGKRCG